MSQIQLLDDATIDQIAAGEVVERPSSVVKELVENAIDAGAAAIAVEIRDGGTSLIRVTDNGCGIASAQIPLAFARHSTSKIQTVEDLSDISSLGFRGEALSSIAAVARVEMISKSAEAMVGCRYVIEGGRETAREEVGAPDGTTLIVRDLFYNTPARRKFLKTPQTEAGAIGDLVERIALSHPAISFKFTNNGQVRLHTSGNGELKDVIYEIYGRELAANLLPVQTACDTFSMTGYIGKPIASRGNRGGESCYVNGRYVKSNVLTRAIEDGYHGFLMQHKYPFAVLLITVDGRLVDVNVHPNKMELRFSNEQELYAAVCAAIAETLRGREMIDDVSLTKETAPKTPSYDKHTIPEPFEAHRRAESAREPIRYDSAVPTADPTAEPPAADIPADRDESVSSVTASGPTACHQETLAEYAPEEIPLLSAEARGRHRLIGQLFDTYWLVEYGDRFYMIDQHAAHEKVLYEEMMRDYREREMTSQMVRPPILVTLSMQEEELLERYGADFARMGFEIEPFGGREYAIRAVPTTLYGLAAEDLFAEMMDEMGSLSERDTPDLVAQRIASMSCKAAVKGNHAMSAAEAEHLIDSLLALENPYFCPHGRPVIIAMTRQEVEKKFKRIV